MLASQFIGDFFGTTSEKSIFVTSLANERGNGGTGNPPTLVGRGDPTRIDEFVRKFDRAGRGIFFCVNTVMPGQTRRAKETIAEVVALHADIDLAKVDATAAEIEAKLPQLLLPPSKVIFSGNGYHCYWLLSEAIKATPRVAEHVEGLLRLVADHIGGDPAVCEVARLMRLPTSHNTKDGAWAEVRLVIDRPCRYELSDLEDWLTSARPFIARKGRASTNTNAFQDIDLPGYGAPTDIEARLANMRHRGAGDASIHQTQLAVTAALLNRGRSVDEVVNVVLAATRAAAGEEGAHWNWHREERDIRHMCDTWARKKANGQRSRTSQESPRAFDAMELTPMHFPEIKYVVPGYIVEGLTLFAGKPKVGKSWLLLHAAHAVASGGITLGDIHCEEGDVLYAALEDSPRRLQARMRKLFPYSPWSARLHFVTEMARLTEGGLDYIKGWIEGAERPRLVIVDTLAMVRMPNRKELTAYDSDYMAVRELRDLAHAKSVAIVLVHHLRKAEADDAYDTVSGTLGLTGAPDTIMVIRRDGENTVLRARGRDLEEVERAAQFDTDTCTWSILGEAQAVRQTNERTAIAEALVEAGDEPLGATQIATACGMRAGNVRRLLGKMKRDGTVKAAKYGKYALNR